MTFRVVLGFLKSKFTVDKAQILNKEFGCGMEKFPNEIENTISDPSSPLIMMGISIIITIVVFALVVMYLVVLVK
jgi:hypothetical protein